MASHSSTLTWKIPWMEEPGRLLSMWLRRVRHNWVTSLSLFTFLHWRRKWQPTPVFLPGESLVAAVYGVTQSRTRLSDFTFTFHFHALEKKWQPAPVFLPGESQGRGSLVGCRLWGRTESDMTERLHYEPLISICFCPQRNMLLSLLQALAHAMSGNPRLKTWEEQETFLPTNHILRLWEELW